ncbi:hypothetical protein VCHA52P453_50105 [Vibrio chagasii]|nr:hypothetical protein VCHA39P226_50114 [Vibrio chagasii]CAH7364605.1 hypothetical protein VCHA52P453_50105 [Vibrio chagasii]CAH7398999.1 hypothetical protein VCHA52P456_70112 [Vibrio chagasii]
MFLMVLIGIYFWFCLMFNDPINVHMYYNINQKTITEVTHKTLVITVTNVLQMSPILRQLS